MKKICLFCNKSYNANEYYGNAKRQLYCSRKCREKDWVKKNPERDKELKKKWRDKQVVLCRWCKKEIPLNIRGCGITLCSDECRKKQRKLVFTNFSKKVSKLFSEFKKKIGCKKCGYNKCGASLEYHHRDRTKKERRIDYRMWYSNNKLIRNEMKKCDLLCSNCHGEVHFDEQKKMDENGDVY